MVLGPQQAPKKGKLGQRSLSPAVVNAVDGDRAIHGTGGQCYFVRVEREAADRADAVAHEAFVETDHVQVVAVCCVDTYILIGRATAKEKHIF